MFENNDRPGEITRNNGIADEGETRVGWGASGLQIQEPFTGIRYGVRRKEIFHLISNSFLFNGYFYNKTPNGSLHPNSSYSAICLLGEIFDARKLKI